MLYTVGEMAKLLGVAPSTLRYYDKEGLLPFLERSEGGMRMFKDSDYEWLKIIECLKKTGMPIKDIRNFVIMALQGDETMHARLELFKKQRKSVRQKIDELNSMLDALDYKCWYYETSIAAGNTSAPENMGDDEIPKRFIDVRKRLKNNI